MVRVVVGVPQLAGDLEDAVSLIPYRTTLHWECERKGITHKDLLSGNARLLPARAYFGLVLVDRGGVDVAVSDAKSVFDGIFDFVGLGELQLFESAFRSSDKYLCWRLDRTYPGPETDGGHLIPGVELEFPA